MLHEWWDNFGVEINATELTLSAAIDFVAALNSGNSSATKLIAIRRNDRTGVEVVYFETAVERPQDLEHSIRAKEPIAVIFSNGGLLPPRVLSLRKDFPSTLHQNFVPQGMPFSLCVDDRPWSEAQLSYTPFELIWRIQLWLSKASRGELHDPSQPPEPAFFPSVLSVVVPSAILAKADKPVELTGYIRPDNENLIITRLIGEPGPSTANLPGFVAVTYSAQPQQMSRLSFAPESLGSLHSELEKCGIDLIGDLKFRLKQWAGIKADDARRLSCRLAVLVIFPVESGSQTANDVRAFLSFDEAGFIGEKLSVLLRNTSEVGSSGGYVAKMSGGANVSNGSDIRVEPAQVHFAFNRVLASTIAGLATPDTRKVLLVGAGSIGSQIAINLAREGAFLWDVVDGDYLLPHNLARHALFPSSVGAPKALALASTLFGLLHEPVDALKCDFLHPEALQDDLNRKISGADVILDASASIAVSRRISEDSSHKARGASVFFNPTGTSAVLLLESSDREIRLLDLESQYYAMLVDDPQLHDHLSSGAGGVRYSGSCRTLTNRIPASNAAVLSGLVAMTLSASVKTTEAQIYIWTLKRDGSVSAIKCNGAKRSESKLGGWRVRYDGGLLNSLSAMRAERLPNETGGILLGVADMSRRIIQIVCALPQPIDSHGTITGFERGVVGLSDELKLAGERTMHQVRYVGEWHSHPKQHSAMPSATDVRQLVDNAAELTAEGLPALMAIAADDGSFSIALLQE